MTAAALLPAAQMTTATAAAGPGPEALLSLLDLKPIGGAPVTASDLAQRPVLITFWASWCPPCRDEFHNFNRITTSYGGRGLLTLGVNVFEDFGGLSSPEKRARFIRQTAPAFQLLEGTDATRAAFGGVSRIPTVMLFDTAGQLAYAFVHEEGATRMHVTYGEMKPVLDALLPA